ncbi:6-hydroxymethylpterin diphosphokinase MptE-like protein [uncultured Selenomonas sp.]|uniref:6-hydroxymethylpterin diphosphokinase MptE-like protein n=1 Tax=uncultured Selenomonas sp. TaxID=159275 RepID=UPI0025E8DBE2|nr:6-hydroxymethylpterin diphosphokinase MptE-like protein [uncultured Selenomonas sp.]
MRFIVWGAGVRGRRVRYFLGNRAAAYIDANPPMQGKILDGLSILSFEDYLLGRDGLYRDAWIIISPRSTDFIESIARELDAHGVVKYFRLQDAITSYYEYDVSQMIAQIAASFVSQEEIGLYGLDSFHADLYERLLEAGRRPVLWIPKEKWEQEAGRRAELPAWDIRCLETKDMPYILDDVALLSRLTNTYATPEMEKFHNMYEGRRCFVVATGPSLRMEDLETLRKHHELCISMNGIFHCFDQVEWRPDFFLMTDQLLVRYEQAIDTIDVSYKLISDSNLDFWKKKHPDNVYRMHVIYGHSMDDMDCFSNDFTMGCYGNFNVANACLQFGTYLGCKEIYLLGVDFSQLVGKKDRVSHFSKDYDEEMRDEDFITKYTDAQMQKLMLKGYQAARRYADNHPPLKIYNATRGGYLEAFERVDFDSLF